jgi:hypothetical protein
LLTISLKVSVPAIAGIAQSRAPVAKKTTDMRRISSIPFQRYGKLALQLECKARANSGVTEMLFGNNGN